MLKAFNCLVDASICIAVIGSLVSVVNLMLCL